MRTMPIILGIFKHIWTMPIILGIFKHNVFEPGYFSTVRYNGSYSGNFYRQFLHFLYQRYTRDPAMNLQHSVINLQHQLMAFKGSHFQELHIKIPHISEHMWTTYFLAENSFRSSPTYVETKTNHFKCSYLIYVYL
jgi:hypothetical protein